MLTKQTKPFAIGMLARFHEEHPSKIFEMLQSLKLEHFQLGGLLDEYLFGETAGEKTGLVKDLIKKTGINISSIFVSFHDQNWSDHKTLGIVPEETRGRRIARTCMTSMWAKQIGTPQICSHVGFIPEDHHSIVYKNFIEDLRESIRFCGMNGQLFALETGQEDVDVLERTITDLGLDNVRINLDPANLLLYDRQDAFYLLKKMGKLVCNIHCKDAIRPANGERGKEMRLGEGDVKIAELISELYQIGYRGPLTIEREIEGEQQLIDVAEARTLLEKIVSKF